MGGHYAATIITGMGIISIIGLTQQLVESYHRKLTPEEYVWWWRLTLGLEAVNWGVGIWPIGLLSLIVWLGLYVGLNDEMKFYREHHLTHRIVDFGFAEGPTPTYKPLAKPVRILFVIGVIIVLSLAFLNLWIHR